MPKRKEDHIADLQPLFSSEELEELDEQFDPCEHERKLRCDACLSREWDKGRKEGFDLGFKWVMAELKKRAGEAYVKDQDSTAKLLRDLVKEITEQAKKDKAWIQE